MMASSPRPRSLSFHTEAPPAAPKEEREKALAHIARARLIQWSCSLYPGVKSRPVVLLPIFTRDFEGSTRTVSRTVRTVSRNVNEDPFMSPGAGGDCALRRGAESLINRMHLLARGLRSHIVAVGASLALAVAADGADALRLDRIYDFGRYEQGGGLVQGPQGEFYVGFFSLRTNAWIVASPPGDGSLQYLFTLPYDNGRPPGYPLIRARDGYFYGTTEFTGRYGRGSIFRASVDGSVTTIHDFDTVHGASPRAGLVEGPDGRLYGVADGGPISQGFYGHGIVFGVEGGGTFADLYDFPVSGKDGFSPEQRLVVGEHGWLFGVTYVGGQNGYGTIFRMKPGSPLHTIYDFSEAD